MSKNPLKISFKTEFLPIFLVVLGFILSLFFINTFPEQVAVHWNLAGEPDGFSNKYSAALMIPVITLAMYLLLTFLPIIDPKKDRYKEFSKFYNYFKVIIIFFMIFIYVVSGLNNLGYNLPIKKITPISVGTLFVLIGFYMKKIKMNWFMGVKNPWTLSSEKVWNKTHKFSGKVFVVSGFLLALTAFVEGKYKLPIFVLALFLIIFSVTIYSYYIYVKELKGKR